MDVGGEALLVRGEALERNQQPARAPTSNANTSTQPPFAEQVGARNTAQPRVVCTALPGHLAIGMVRGFRGFHHFMMLEKRVVTTIATRKRRALTAAIHCVSAAHRVAPNAVSVPHIAGGPIASEATWADLGDISRLGTAMSMSDRTVRSECVCAAALSAHAPVGLTRHSVLPSPSKSISGAISL